MIQFTPAVPPGTAATPESFYTGLDLESRAGPDRPYVICNFVGSADGKATAGGRTAPLGGEGDRAAFHLLRTQCEALLAGTGTMRIERYGRLIRDEGLAAIRAAEGRSPQPLSVVVSRSGAVPFEIPLFADTDSRIALYAPAGIEVPGCAAEISLHELAPERHELAGVLRSLRHELGVRSLLCEGGPQLFNALLAEDLVDELFLTLSPTLVGGHELAITAGEELPTPVQLELVWALEHESNLLLRYARR